MQGETSARERVRSKRKARKRQKTMRVALVAGVVAVALGVAYGVGLRHFSSHFFPNTQVAGLDASGRTADEVAQALADAAQSYVTEVSNGSFELRFVGSDVGVSCDAQAVANDLLHLQDAAQWPAHLFGAGTTLDQSVFTYDEKKLASFVGEAVATYNESARLPVSATMELSPNATEFVLVSEEEGTALDVDAVVQAVGEAVSRGGEKIELESDALVQPALRASDAAALEARSEANATLGLRIPLLREQDELMELSAESFAAWLVVHDDLSLGIDPDAAATWADQNLWRAADYNDGTNAYALDSEAFAAAISSAIQSGSEEPVTISYVVTPLYLPGGGTLNPAPWNAERGRYLDVNKAAQVACLFDAQGNVLWESEVTTGNEASGNGTPVGEYDIYDKQTDFVLIGYDEDGDGNPDYEHHVDYWMPFNGGVGLHDASWREVYGGTEYLDNGSGGCVNVPRDAIAPLFAMTHRTEVILVHD